MTNRPKALLLEDVEEVRQELGADLERLGYEVIEAEDADTARRLLKDEACELALLDVVLPVGASGLYLAAWLRIEYPELPVILMSGYATVQTVTEAMKLGVTEFLHKPVSQRDLSQAIKRMLSGERPERLAAPAVANLTPDEAERQRIMTALDETDGNRTRAARILGISRSTLWSRMRALGIRFRPTKTRKRSD